MDPKPEHLLFALASATGAAIGSHIGIRQYTGSPEL